MEEIMRVSNLQVLLLDDNSDTGELLQAVFDNKAWRLRVATSVADARALARSTWFDAYIVDERLPDGSGLEFCRWARGEGDPNTPILIFTACAEFGLLEKARGISNLRIQTKPADPYTIRRLVYRMILSSDAALTAALLEEKAAIGAELLSI